MIRVALITSWPPELCGIASNSVNVVNHRQPDIEYKIISGAAWAGYPVTTQKILDESADCQIVHLSYERNLHAGLDPNAFRLCKARGQKTVITYHNVWPGDHQDDAMLSVFDTVVSQDPASPAERGFVYIPQGVMQVEGVPDDKVEMKIGTAGFPTQQKHGHVVARVAEALGLSMLMFAPTSRHADAMWMAGAVRHHVPSAELIHDFLPQEVIVNRLSECVMTLWLYVRHGGQSGISGSVRLGLATKRPVIISRCGMYRDLWARPEWADEIYFCESDYPVFEEVLPVAQQVLEDVKSGKYRRPNRIVEDMNWTEGGRLYATVYRSLLGITA